MQEQTPLEQAAWLTEVTGNNFLLKREDLQPVRLRQMELLATRHCVIPCHGQYMIHCLCSWQYRLEQTQDIGQICGVKEDCGVYFTISS